MRAVTVYRMDYTMKTRYPLGAGRRFHQDGAIMFLIGLLGFLTGVAMVAWATSSFHADAADILGPGSTTGMLIFLGSGLVGLGIRGRKKIMKIIQGTPSDGRYLALGMREVNLRGASLFQRTGWKEGEDE